MKFACAECGARYQIANEKLKPRGVKVRCKKCGHVNKVEPEPAAGAKHASEPPAPAATSLDSDFSIDVEGTDARAAAPSVDDDRPRDTIGVDLKASPELSSLQDALQSELEDAPVPLPPAPGTEDVPPSASAEAPPSEDNASVGAPSSASSAATADLSPDVGIESEIGSAFEAMFSPEGRAADHAPITPAPAEPEPEIAPFEPPLPKDAVWYVAVRDEQLGPLTRDELEQYWTTKKIGPQSLCWKQGMTDWLPMVAVGELQSLPGMDQASEDEESYEGLPHLRAPSELVPAPAPRAASEVDWKPSAASALASLAAEEMADAPEPPRSQAPVTVASGEAPAVGLAAAAAPTGSIEPAAAPATLMPAAAGPTTIPPAAVPAGLPAAAPVRPGLPAWLIAVAAGAVVALLLGAGAFLYLRGGGGGEPSAPVAALVPDLGVGPVDAGAAAAGAGTADVGPTDMETGGADVGPVDAGAAKPEQKLAVDEKDDKKPARRTRRRRRPSRRITRKQDPTPPRPSNPPEGSDVDDLLSGATGGGSSGGSLPRVPDDGDVFNAIRQHGSEVRGCVAEQLRADPSLKGRMQVKLRVAGTGKVMSVAVSPAQFRDAPVGRCLERSAKSWRFPRFSGPPFPVEFPVPVQ